SFNRRSNNLNMSTDDFRRPRDSASLMNESQAPFTLMRFVSPLSSISRVSFWARVQLRVLSERQTNFPSTVPSVQHGQLHRRYRRLVCGQFGLCRL
ncbi:MAG: hypothetical protein ACRDHZ_16180, partial [Ktedonobacteraceae bacterium]